MPNFDIDFDDRDFDDDRFRSVGRRGVTKKVKPTRIINKNKPTLVILGEHMIDPKDVAAIKRVKSKEDLYVIVLKSQPNMEFPVWASGEEVEELLKHFNLVG